VTYTPTAYEKGLWHWLDSVVGSTVDDIRYANQPFAVGGKTVVTIQVLQVTQEMTPSRRLTIPGRHEEIESAYTGTVSVQVFGPNHRAIAQTIVRSLWRDDIGRTNTANGVEVRGEVGGIQDLSALIATDYLARSGVDFSFSFRQIWTADEASAAITAAAATGMGGTAFVEQSKRIAAALRGESTVTVGASVSMTASATIEGASTVSVGATVRVPVSVQCVGGSSVIVGAMARRIAEATCAGASSVLVGGMVRRLAKTSPIIGASSVIASTLARRMAIVATSGGSVVTASGGIRRPYDDIEALNPDFFVQFKYPVYAGQQALFRDELCTSPVTDAGNHTIGGAKNPFSGDIVLTQASASARPLWGGGSVGAVFDAIDDFLESPSSLILALPYTLGIRQRNTNADTTRQTFIHYGASYLFREGGSLKSAVAYTFPNDTSYPNDMSEVMLIKEALANPPAATASVEWNGNRTEQTQASETVAFGTSGPIIVGSQAGSIRFAAMEVSFVVAFARVLSEPEKAILRGAP